MTQSKMSPIFTTTLQLLLLLFYFINSTADPGPIRYGPKYVPRFSYNYFSDDRLVLFALKDD